MILFMIVFVLMIIGIIFSIREYREYKEHGWSNGSGALCIVIATLCLIIMMIVSAVIHIGSNATIIINDEKYNSLIYRIECIDSDYEDMSKSDLIRDINDWNVYVQSSKYWTYNAWTSWFFSKKVADNLQYIPISEVK